MAENRSRVTNSRILLLTLAIAFSTATVVYSVAWMYYIRLSSLPVEVGMDSHPTSSGMLVDKVWNDSPAQRAGLQPNDVITAIGDRSVAAPVACDRILFRVWHAAQPGDSVALKIRRPGQAEPLFLTPVFRAAKGSGDAQSLVRRGAAEVLGFYPLLFLIVGLAVLFLRVEDSNAWLLAFMFAGFISEADVPLGFALAPDSLLHFLFSYALI
ncbi:MAG TPA: PDZ domain-containing protein, partial [Chthonomonadaceae bacterium]|nr:PDZ domain-containing protein [Chthonomonadaceae bacterium]